MSGQKSSADELQQMLLLRPGKWTLVIITSLKGGTHRFSELQRRIGKITQKTLASTLKELERDGFVRRTPYATIPPRVDYELTRTGLELLEVAEIWQRFIVTHHEEVERARREFDSQFLYPKTG